MKKTPNIVADTKPEEALVNIFKGNNGVFVGEDHDDISAIKLICNALPELKDEALSIIFLEHFDQADQPVIDEYLDSKDRNLLTEYLSKEGWDWELNHVDAIIDLIDAADANGVKVMGIDDDRYNDPDIRNEVDNIWAKYILDVTGGNAKFLILAGSGHSGNYPGYKGVDVLLKIPSFDYNDGECTLDEPPQKPNTVIQGDGLDADYYFRMDL